MMDRTTKTRTTMSRTLALSGLAGIALAGTLAGPAQAMPDDHPTCADDQVQVRVEESPGGGSAGGHEVKVVATNTSSNTCRVKGYPGVDHLGPNGTLGAPAERVPTTTARSVVLAPQQSASARLRITETNVYPSAECAPTSSPGFQLYAPNGTQPRTSTMEHRACAQDKTSSLKVWPFEAAS